MLDGELVVGLQPVIGYVHTGIEKNIEQKTYWKAITYVPRMDYLSFFTARRRSAWRSRRRSTWRCRAAREWIRVLFQELNRIHSHLIFLGTGSVDLGGIALLFYCFRDRDLVLDLFEMVTGQRMHPRYCQVGGVSEDLPRGFERECRSFVTVMRKKLDEYDGLIAANPIWRQRTEGVGIAPPDFAIKMGLSGPNLRASGIPYDLRSANGGYGAYREIGYTPVTHADGDTAARFRVRIEEMRASLDVIEKVLDGIPAGPVHLGRPQGRAAAAPRAAHLDGVADPPLQAGDRGLPRAGRADLRADRVAARRVRLPPRLRRQRQALARAPAQPQPGLPAVARAPCARATTSPT